MTRRSLWLALLLVTLSGCQDVSSPAAPETWDGGAPSFGHLDPLPATFEDLVCGFVSDLDELLFEFGLGGGFGDDRLNRALARAESKVVEARVAATVPDLAEALRALKAATRELEKGAAVPVSGSGFADDLASFGSFLIQTFTGDLITLATNLGAASSATIAEATAHFESGVAARSMDEWERSVADFEKAVRAIEREVQIGPPCG